MPDPNFIVSGLSSYVKQNDGVLLKNIMFGKGTRARISIQPGVKSSEALHPFEVATSFASAAGCGFSPSGTVTISERVIAVTALKQDLEICPKTLIGKYAEYLVKTNAQEQGESLPFEEEVMQGIIASLNMGIETLIWLGNTSLSSDPVKKWFNGFIALASASVSGSTGVVGVNITSGKSAYEGIDQVVRAIPSAVKRYARNMNTRVEVNVAPEIFDAYMLDLVALNYVHYNPEDTDFVEYKHPGTNIWVVSTDGLEGDLHILATYPQNLYYGTDGENDEEILKAWYSEDNGTFRIKAEWKSGVQIAFLDRVVLGTFAAAPVAVAGMNASLSAIAGSAATSATNSANLATIATNTGATKDAAAELANANHVFKTKEQA